MTGENLFRTYPDCIMKIKTFSQQLMALSHPAREKTDARFEGQPDRAASGSAERLLTRATNERLVSRMVYSDFGC